jgi:hypothetical protein
MGEREKEGVWDHNRQTDRQFIMKSWSQTLRGTISLIRPSAPFVTASASEQAHYMLRFVAALLTSAVRPDGSVKKIAQLSKKITPKSFLYKRLHFL